MSLIQAHRVAVAIGAALALGGPVWLLSGGDAPPPRAAAPPPTQIEPSPAGTLAYALTSPPFTPGRTVRDAAPDAAADASGAAEAPVAAAPPPSPPTLVGLVVGTRGRSVALVRGAGGETVTLARGEQIDGWTLVAVTRERATFDLGGSRHVATLDFSNRTPGGGGTAHVPPPAPPAPFAPSAPAPRPPGPPAPTGTDR
jgi:hypothetical protein